MLYDASTNSNTGSLDLMAYSFHNSTACVLLVIMTPIKSEDCVSLDVKRRAIALERSRPLITFNISCLKPE